MKQFSIFIFTIFFMSSYGQYGRGTMYNKKNADAFPEPLQYHMKGWYFGAGPTFMQPQVFFFIKDLVTNSSQIPASKVGVFIEVGRYNIFEWPGLFKYMDYGLAYKSLRGKERTSGGSFGDHYIEGHFNLNNRIKLSRTSFLQNTIGIDSEYAFLRNNSGSFPSAFVTSMHYKFGFGYKVNKKLMIIPSIETPILTFYPLEYGSSTLGYLSSRYRPIIISLKFLILRPKIDECPYVPPPPSGLPVDGEGGSNNGGVK